MNKNEKLLSNINKQISNFNIEKYKDVRTQFLDVLKEVFEEGEFTPAESEFIKQSEDIVEKCYAKFDKYFLALENIKISARDCLATLLHHMDLGNQPFNAKKHHLDEEM